MKKIVLGALLALLVLLDTGKITSKETSWQTPDPDSAMTVASWQTPDPDSHTNTL